MVLDVHSYPRAEVAPLLEMPVSSATSVSVIPRRVCTAVSRVGRASVDADDDPS